MRSHRAPSVSLLTSLSNRRPRVARAMERPCCLPSLSSHRPLLLLPRHLPKHPLIPRADDERFFHPPLFFLARRLGPLVHFLAHPALHLGEFGRCVEHEPVPIRMILLRRAMLQEMLPDDAVDPGAGKGDGGDLCC